MFCQLLAYQLEKSYNEDKVSMGKMYDFIELDLCRRFAIHYMKGQQVLKGKNKFLDAVTTHIIQNNTNTLEGDAKMIFKLKRKYKKNINVLCGKMAEIDILKERVKSLSEVEADVEMLKSEKLAVVESLDSKGIIIRNLESEKEILTNKLVFLKKDIEKIRNLFSAQTNKDKLEQAIITIPISSVSVSNHKFKILTYNDIYDNEDLVEQDIEECLLKNAFLNYTLVDSKINIKRFLKMKGNLVSLFKNPKIFFKKILKKHKIDVTKNLIEYLNNFLIKLFGLHVCIVLKKLFHIKHSDL